MPHVEHGLPRSGDLLVRVLLILFSFSIGSARAERSTFSRVDALLSEGREEEARAELARLADDHEGSDLGHEALYRLNDLEPDGAAYLERLARLAAEWNDARVWLDLGLYRYAVGAYEAAAADFERAARLSDGEEERIATGWRGASLVAAGRMDDGLDVLLETARAGGEKSRAGMRARFVAAGALLQSGERDRAEKTLRPLLERANEFEEAARVLLAGTEGKSSRGARALPLPEEKEPADAPPAAPTAAPGRSEARAEAETPDYYVQVAAFEHEENALRFVASQRAEGIGAIEICPSARGDALLYLVRVGPFRSPEEASTARENLARHGLEGKVVHEGAKE
ncbi:MAG: SPOR domain-containing protein [Candidatus Latescibacterota bacterium]|nr:MAG: SPOR domain-containing protein [Candidatus Latescibacterota bacterium]